MIETFPKATTPTADFNSTTSIKDAIYMDWFKQKQERAKQELKEKKRQEKEEEEKKQKVGLASVLVWTGRFVLGIKVLCH